MRGERDERPSTFARRARETHRLRAFGLDAGNHHQRDPSRAQQLLRASQPVLSVARANQDRTLSPERARDSAEPIDPDRPLSAGNRRMTGGSQNSARSSLWHPHSEPPPGETSPGKNLVEHFDSRRDRLGCPVGDGGRIGKTMLDECPEGGVAFGHLPASISRTYPESKKSTLCGSVCVIPGVKVSTVRLSNPHLINALPF